MVPLLGRHCLLSQAGCDINMVLQVHWTRGGGEWQYGEASAYILGPVLVVLGSFRATWPLEFL